MAALLLVFLELVGGQYSPHVNMGAKMYEADLRFEAPDPANQRGDFFVVRFAFRKEHVEPAFSFNQPIT